MRWHSIWFSRTLCWPTLALGHWGTTCAAPHFIPRTVWKPHHALQHTQMQHAAPPPQGNRSPRRKESVAAGHRPARPARCQVGRSRSAGVCKRPCPVASFSPGGAAGCAACPSGTYGNRPGLGLVGGLAGRHVRLPSPSKPPRDIFCAGRTPGGGGGQYGKRASF